MRIANLCICFNSAQSFKIESFANKANPFPAQQIKNFENMPDAAGYILANESFDKRGMKFLVCWANSFVSRDL
jgi:hypothetical protein